jgi:hypothetical protein
VFASAIALVGLLFVSLFWRIRKHRRANARLAKDQAKLIKVLHQHEQNAEIYKQNEAVYKSRIERLEQKINLLLEVLSDEPLSKKTAEPRFEVQPDGNELFLPLLDSCRVYEITLEGTCKFSESSGRWSERTAYADALYQTDEVGNFFKPHSYLKLGDVPIEDYLTDVPHEIMPTQDRKEHRYSFRIDGAAERMSVRFHVRSSGERKKPHGPLTLSLKLMPEGTASPNAGRRREEAAQEIAKRAKQAESENAAIQARLEPLKRRALLDSHFLDPKFQEEFAKHNQQKIPTALKKAWEDEYERFIKDAPLKKLAEEQTPEVIQLFEARVKIVQLAERLAVAPVTKEITPEEERALMVRKQKTKVDGLIAHAKLKGEKIAEAKAVIDEIALDQDEKEYLQAELVRQISEGEESHQNGKGSVTL